MGRLLIVVAVISACGRIRFDPIDERVGDAARDGIGPGSGDGGGPGDGPGGDASMPDALAAACAQAIPVQVNTPLTRDTCVTGQDIFDGCGPAGRQEVVFKFVAPVTSGYTIRAFDTGTSNVSNSTGRINDSCAATGNCAGILGLAFSANSTTYFVVEASATACATIDFSVTMP